MDSIANKSAVLLMVLMVVAVAVAGQQASGPAPVPVPAQNQVPGDGVRRITPAEVRAALDNGEAIIVDVRTEVGYEAGHVKGALSIPFSDLTSRISELPRDKMIITYCS